MLEWFSSPLLLHSKEIVGSIPMRGAFAHSPCVRVGLVLLRLSAFLSESKDRLVDRGCLSLYVVIRPLDLSPGKFGWAPGPPWH